MDRGTSSTGWVGRDRLIKITGNVAMNSGLDAGAGAHTSRLCAAAYHVDTLDVMHVDAARISAIWASTSMGDSVSPFSVVSAGIDPEGASTAEAMMNAFVSKTTG